MAKVCSHMSVQGLTLTPPLDWYRHRQGQLTIKTSKCQEPVHLGTASHSNKFICLMLHDTYDHCSIAFKRLCPVLPQLRSDVASASNKETTNMHGKEGSDRVNMCHFSTHDHVAVYKNPMLNTTAWPLAH